MNDNRPQDQYIALSKAAQCRCGMWLPRGSTAKINGNENYPYHCVGCRPRDAIYESGYKVQ